jgi:DNA repair protein RecO
MSLKKGKAIVLRKSRTGEKDLIAHLLLENGEKRMLRLHGILASKNRSPLLGEPGTLIEINYYDNNREELSLKEGTVIKRHDALKSDYRNQELLSKILILGNLASSGAPDPFAFVLLRSALEYAETSIAGPGLDHHRAECFLIFLCVRVLDFMGLLGSTKQCAQCGRSLQDRALFAEGAFFICERCNALADTTGFQCSLEIANMLARRYRDIESHVEGLDAPVFQQLKSGLQRGLRFSVPQPPEIFE